MPTHNGNGSRLKNFKKRFLGRDTVLPVAGQPDIMVTEHGTFKTGPIRKPGDGDPGKPQIFKVQRPLFTTDPEPKLLVYNEDRSWQAELPDSPAWDQIFQGSHKVFIIGSPDPVNNSMKVTHVISDQGW